MQCLDIAFGWSLAAAFSMSTGLVTFFAVVAVVAAVVATITAAALQSQEEHGYRLAHPIQSTKDVVQTMGGQPNRRSPEL
jgi:hypothetical protein